MLVQIGIDWARHDAVAVVQCDQKRRRLKFERSLAGVGEVLKVARGLGGEGADVQVSLEAGDPGLMAALTSSGACVYVQDPKQARRFAESCSSGGVKDDQRDAENLLRMLSSVEHRRERFEVPETQRELAGMLLDDHDDVERKKHRVINQLRAELVKVHPALERELKVLTKKAPLVLLEAAPTWQHAATLSEDDLVELRKKCRFREQNWQRISTALAVPWIEMPAELVQAHAARVRRLVAELQQLMVQQEQLDKSLQSLADQVPIAPTLRSTPGIGVVAALSLVVLGADQLVHGERDALAIWCGAAPVRRQSGKSLNQVRMRKSAPLRGRRAVYLIAMQALVRLSWAKAQYRYLRKRGKEHGTALRIVGRAVLRVLGALLRKGEVYDEAKYLQALQAHGVTWAVELASAPADADTDTEVA